MTSQNVENNNNNNNTNTNSTTNNNNNHRSATSSTTTTIINNNVKLSQSILMRERNRNQINNKNILLLNRTVGDPSYNVKNSSFIQIGPTTSSNFLTKVNVSKLIQESGGDEVTYFDSDVEIIDECDSEGQLEQKRRGNHVGGRRDEGPKKETPLLQIFDGNVVISQELSIEEVQSLLHQINSKLQTQNNVNSTDFPNITFSKEENSDVEIILEDENCSSSASRTNEQLGLNWTTGQNVENRKVLVKSLKSVNDKVGKVTTGNQPSTSSETNLLISFKKAFEDRKTESNDYDHNYHGGAPAKENEVQKKKSVVDSVVQHVIVENSGTELMQIEVVENGAGSSATATVPVVSSSSCSSIPEKDGEPIKLPENLESVPKAEHLPTQRHRWNTNEEIAAILISFEKHSEWQSKEVKIRPKSGSMLLYSRKKVRYRRDGYCWKKRKDGKTTREDHMKLKVQGTECIYGCYVHSAILPTFHRRCYWLLQNPDIVLVHYLNVPYPDDNKLAVFAPSLALWGDKKEWTKEELVSQLKPMFYSEEERDLNNELDISTAEKVEAIVTQLMEKQRAARAATLTKQLECGCPDSTCADGKTCSHPMRRITAANVKQDCSARTVGQLDSNNQVSSTTGSGVLLASTNVNGSGTASIHHRVGRSDRIHQSHPSSLVLSLSQIHSAGGLSLSQIQEGTNLLILNNPSSSTNSSHTPTSVAMVTNFKCTTSAAAPTPHQQQPPLKQYHHPRNKVTLKHESMDTNQISCCRIANNGSSGSKLVGDINGSRSNMTGVSSTFVSTMFTNGKSSDVVKDLNSLPVTPTKSMDTSEGSGETILLLNSSSGNRPNSMSSVVSGSSFYNETLDLSQEDIQRTLSANMPLSELTTHRNRRNSQSKSPSPVNAVIPPDVMVPEINPMELMDSPPTVVDDDVFVNLDAFDMLSDFPELEVLDHSGNNSGTLMAHGDGGSGSGGGSTACKTVNGCAQSANQEEDTNKEVKDESDSTNLRSYFREGSASITDYSPEWAYPEGGVKVLVTGPWYSSTSRYTVLFDSFPVPTMLVQSGVLRCFCPAHEVGLATVQVACEGFIISNTVMFEYKRPPNNDSVKIKEPKLEENENLLKFTLLQRLEAVDGRLHIKEEPGGGDVSDSAAGLYHQGINFEERMVNYCSNMTQRRWRDGDESSSNWMSGHRGMTLLHLAASLGYARLVCSMLHWRAENSSLLLETEVDALSQDDEGFTPLMWACGRGHRETALVLYRWNHMALHIHNSSQQTALAYARAQGQIELAREIEKLEESREEANMTLLSNTTNNLDKLNEITDTTPTGSPSSSMTSLNSSKSHDGIFLRPDPVTTKSDVRFKASLINSSSDRSKTPSPTFGGGLLENYDPFTLVKRPSVDSGINLGFCQSDSLPSLRSSFKFRTGSSTGETSKLSRFDRSMSLPSPAVCDSFESDGRRMDFALCEVTAAGPSSTSPTNDVENISENDVDVSTGHVDEQEVRVLTLAEQIIAAIPERIKNESEEMQLDTSPADESSLASDGLSDSLMEPFLEEPSSSYHPQGFNFEFSDHNYRYYDVTTPSSSLSPASSSLQSPSPGFQLDSPSPPPTTQDFCEFFHASGSIFEKDFSNLTLSDREQRELYEAAKIIQKAYRSYKGRKKLEEDKERAAAILIQNYYRRYKRYAYFKQMTHAAMVIQNGYRSYCEHKRFKKSQEAAVCIQNYYRHYKEQGESRRTSRETTPSTGLKRTYSQRRQHQAACKIQQFMRQSKNKLQKERVMAAEKGRLDARLSSQDVRRKSQSPDSFGPNNRCHDKNADIEDS